LFLSLKGLKARLVQTISYLAEDNKRKECEVILRAIGGNKIQRNHTKVWEDQLLWVPRIPPTNQVAGNNIQVAYHIEVRSRQKNSLKECVFV